MDDVFKAAEPVLERIEAAGFEAYFVGGAVRDYILGRKISDIDIASSATPLEIKAIFSKTIDVGIQHGTVIVFHNGQQFEVTTFRTESEYQDFRRPEEVVFVRSLEADLMRRDFTMNAIAMDRKGRIFDPFGGQDAIVQKRIASVGKAEDRFGEDALRMLRAIRFLSQLGFTMDSETYEGLLQQAPLLSNIAVERKKVEFEKLLLGKNQKKALEMMVDTEIYKYLPGLDGKLEVLTKFIAYQSPELKIDDQWALLLECLQLSGKQAENFLRGWCLSVKQLKKIMKISDHYRKRLIGEWDLYELYLVNPDIIVSVENIRGAILGIDYKASSNYWLTKYETLPIKTREELSVTGTDVMLILGKSGGPWLKDTLEMIEIQILEGQLRNQPDDIKEWLLKCNQK